MTYRTLGIVLRRRDVREHDRLYTIFTKSHGKIEAITRGSRKINSKLSPHLESFATVDLLIAKGRFWDHVAGVESVERFGTISDKFYATWAAFYVFELTDSLTRMGYRDYGLWNLLMEYMRTLNGLPQSATLLSLKQVVRAYSCQLLLRLGVAPELSACHACKGEIVGDSELSPSGLVCASCALKNNKEQSLRLAGKVLNPLRDYHTNALQSFVTSSGVDSEPHLSTAVNFLLRSHLSAPLKSEKIFGFI